MVCLPALVLGAQIKCAGVLEVWRQDNGLIAGLARQLDTQVPRVEGHECEFVLFGDDVLLCELIEAVDGIPEGAGVPNLIPG